MFKFIKSLFTKEVKVSEIGSSKNQALLEEIYRLNLALKKANSTVKYDESGNIERAITGLNDYEVDNLYNSESNISYMQERLNRETADTVNPEKKQLMVNSMSAQIRFKGYKSIPDIVNSFGLDIAQLFLMQKLNALGQYAPEYDNLDSLNRAELTKVIEDINLVEWELKQLEQGKDITPTPNQVKICAKLGIKVPVTKKLASIAIDEEMKKLGLEPTDKNITDKQRARYNRLKEITGVSAKDEKSIDDKFKMSKAIDELQKVADGISKETKATDKQIEYYARLLKLTGKKFVGKKKAFAESTNQFDMSLAIEELKKEYDEKFPYATEGQVKYASSLLDNLRQPYNVEDLKIMLKADCTKLIRTKQRELLSLLSMQPVSSFENISDDDVKAQIGLYREERSTKADKVE